tara:strand:+ start:1922 stop:2839 length:918 start_codon:yes stop_codon:yes gene_type:complete
MKKLILIFLPLIAIVVSLFFLCSSEEEQLKLRIAEVNGSYFIKGKIGELTGVYLSNGKRIEIDDATGEIIPCPEDIGLNSIRLTWGINSNKSDTIISSVNSELISLNRDSVRSVKRPICPPSPVSEVEFIVNGPDKDCKYEITISKSIYAKGYKKSDFYFSLNGKNGDFKKLEKWQVKKAGRIDLWVKVNSTEQLVSLSSVGFYEECNVFVCDKAIRTTLEERVKRDVSNYIVTYSFNSWKKLSEGRRLNFFKDGIKVTASDFSTEVQVNGDNMSFGDDINRIKILSVSSTDCEKFDIKYTYDDK